MQAPGSLYLHVPFCRHRCGYCNFTLVAGRDHLIDEYLNAVELEMQYSPPATLDTVFIGGGTPTHLSIRQMDRLFGQIEKSFELLPECEFSVEGNPRDFDAEKVEFLADRGVNRVSLGVQSFHDRKLSILERDHDRKVVREATELIRRRIPNLSIDLIFGVRDEVEQEWTQDLEMAMECRPTHMSTYSLTIEKGTRFWNAWNRNEVMQVDEDTAAHLYENGIGLLSQTGLKHYEVSNFALPGFQCLHNINYWNGGEYLGIGPGAARYVDGIRATNHQSTTRYIKLMNQNGDATFESEAIDDEQRAREILVFGLRQIDGVCLVDFEKRTGRRLLELAGNVLEGFLQQELLQLDANRLSLTRKGLLVSDSIWPELI